MYVRWQYRWRSKPAFGSGKVDVGWSAILVENVRIDGKPTQRHIAYLAGFTESAMAIPAQQRFIWEAIEARLDSLNSRISPEDRKRIEAALIKRLGKPPTKKQREELDRKFERLLGELAQTFAKPHR